MDRLRPFLIAEWNEPQPAPPRPPTRLDTREGEGGQGGGKSVYAKVGAHRGQQGGGRGRAGPWRSGYGGGVRRRRAWQAWGC